MQAEKNDLICVTMKEYVEAHCDTKSFSMCTNYWDSAPDYLRIAKNALSSRAKGNLGEKVVSAIYGENFTKNSKDGHISSFFNREIPGGNVEIKLSFYNPFTSMFYWNQIRNESEDWKVLSLVGVHNDKIIIWEVPRDKLKTKPGHVGDKDTLKCIRLIFDQNPDNEELVSYYNKFIVKIYQT